MIDLHQGILEEFTRWGNLERFRQRDGWKSWGYETTKRKPTLPERRAQSQRKRAAYAEDIEHQRAMQRAKYARQMKDPAMAEKRRVRLREWMRDKRAKLRGEDVAQ